MHPGKESGQGGSPGVCPETSPQDAGGPGHWPLRLSPRLPCAAEGPGGVAQGLVGASRTHLRSSLGCQSPSLLWQLKDTPAPLPSPGDPPGSLHPVPRSLRSSRARPGSGDRDQGSLGQATREAEKPLRSSQEPQEAPTPGPPPALTIIGRLHQTIPPGPPRAAPRWSQDAEFLVLGSVTMPRPLRALWSTEQREPLSVACPCLGPAPNSPTFPIT